MILRIPHEILNMLAQVPRERQTLTTDGLVYEGVRYRFNPEGTSDLLSANYHRTPHRFRLEGTAKVYVKIRCWDGDIDKIEVIDDVTGAGIPMWSTNRLYTGGLSRWEHHQYQEMIRKRRGPGQSNPSQNDVEREIMATKARFLNEYDSRRPKMPLRGSAIATALVECEEHRQAAFEQALATGPEAERVSCAAEDVQEQDGKVLGSFQGELFGDLGTFNAPNVIEPPIGHVAAGEGREDEPRPPLQRRKRKEGKAQWPKAPARPKDFGTFSTAELTRPTGKEAPLDDMDDSGDCEHRNPAPTQDGPNLWPNSE